MEAVGSKGAKLRPEVRYLSRDFPPQHEHIYLVAESRDAENTECMWYNK